MIILTTYDIICLSMIIFTFGGLAGGALTIIYQLQDIKMETSRQTKLWFKLIGIILLAVGVCGFIITMCQDVHADENYIALEPAEPVPESLLEVQKKILRDWYIFNTSTEYDDENVFDILAQLSKIDEIPAGKICELINRFEDYGRELRNIQSGVEN